MSKALLIQAREFCATVGEIIFLLGGTPALEKLNKLHADLTAAIDAPEPEPMFWVRLCSDDCYEGPIHNAGIERVRKLSGAWSPLYLHPPAARDPLTQPDKQRLWNDACYNNKSSTTDAAMEFGSKVEAAHGITAPPIQAQHLPADDTEGGAA